MALLRSVTGLLQDQVYLIVILCLVSLFVPWNDVFQSVWDVLIQAREQVQEYPVLMALAYVACFILLTAISIPGPTALLLAVLGGWLFSWWALPLSSFSSSTGASLAFLTSRYWMKDSMLFRYWPQLQKFNEDRSHAPWVILLSCRLNPLIPYFIENLYFGRTRMPLWQFWSITCLGMLPLTTLYVMTGAELAKVDTYQELISWRIITCFVAASLVPLLLYAYYRRKMKSNFHQGLPHGRYGEHQSHTGQTGSDRQP